MIYIEFFPMGEKGIFIMRYGKPKLFKTYKKLNFNSFAYDSDRKTANLKFSKTIFTLQNVTQWTENFFKKNSHKKNYNTV